MFGWDINGKRCNREHRKEAAVIIDIWMDVIFYIKLLLVPVAVIYFIVLFKKISHIEQILKEWKTKEKK